MSDRRPRPRARARLAAVVVVAALLLWALALALPGTSRLAAGPNHPVDPERAQDPLAGRSENSPTLVADPRHPATLVLVSRIDTPRFGCELRVSHDRGVTWQEAPLPLPAGGTLKTPCFAPDAAFGGDGTLYISYTSLGSAPEAVWLVTSTDDGATFGPPRRAAGPLAFQVRITADRSRAGRVYLTWLQASETMAWGIPEGHNPIVASRSDDAGATWGQPVEVTPASRPRSVAPTPVVAMGGDLIVAYIDVQDDRLDYLGAHEGRGGDPYDGPWSIVVARSTDGGGRWSETAVDDEVHPARRFLQLLAPTPALATDASGKHVYVAFPRAAAAGAAVSIWASEDGGQRFRTASTFAVGDTGGPALPALAVARSGRVTVLYYQGVASKVGAVTRTSHDGGRTFSAPVRVSDATFDGGSGYGDDRGLPELGSRLALLILAGATVAVWADARASVPGSERQDLAESSLVVRTRHDGREAVRAVAAALSALAVVLVAAAVVPGVRLRRRAELGHLGG